MFGIPTWILGVLVVGLALVGIAAAYRKHDATDSDIEIDTERWDAAGEALAKRVVSVGSAAGRLWNSFARNFVKLVPFRQRVFRRMAIKSLYNYHRVAGGDAIGFNALPNGKVDLQPIKYKDALGGDDKPGWKAKGREKTWGAGAEGRGVDYIGKTPIVLLDDDAADKGSFLQSRVAEAIDLGQHQPLFTNPEFILEVQSPPEADGSGPAVADGGQVDGGPVTLSAPQLKAEGVFSSDCIIDLSSPSGADGMRVSWRKYKELYGETATTEEMKRQEERGRIAELKKNDKANLAFKMMLVALGIIAVVELGPTLVAGLFGVTGSAGGGGGSAIPTLTLGRGLF